MNLANLDNCMSILSFDHPEGMFHYANSSPTRCLDALFGSRPTSAGAGKYKGAVALGCGSNWVRWRFDGGGTPISLVNRDFGTGFLL